MNPIFAVITTYAPAESLREHVAHVIPEVDRVVIVDDGATRANRELLTAWFGGEPAVTVLSMETNSGIAAALNHGIRWAKERSAEAVLTLDDDSAIAPGLVSALRHHRDCHEKTQRVGLVAAKWAAGGRLADGAEIRAAERKPVRDLITSGCLMPICAFDAVGGFREEFFIDSVDFDLCLKLRAAGYAVLEVQAQGLSHEPGEGASRNILGRTVHSTNHSPLRRYYAVRNSLTLAREQVFSNPGYALRASVWWPVTLARIILVEQDRRKKLAAMWRGLRDFVARRYGRRPS